MAGPPAPSTTLGCERHEGESPAALSFLRTSDHLWYTEAPHKIVAEPTQVTRAMAGRSRLLMCLEEPDSYTGMSTPFQVTGAVSFTHLTNIYCGFLAAL